MKNTNNFYDFCYRRLFDFIRKRLQNDAELYSVMRSYKLDCIFYDEFENLDNSIRLQVNSKLLEQRARYDLFLKELSNLAQCAKSEGIKMLVLKGIILANDLFSPIETRSSHDMDLLVDFSDLQKMDKILRNNGYVVLHEDTYTNTVNHVIKYKSIRNELTHVTPYHKEFSDGQVCDIDLHIHFCHYFPFIIKEDEKSPFMMSVSQKIPGIETEIMTLNVYDTTIHLCAHFTRHFYWEFFRFFRGESHFEIRHDLLFELSLYIKKHEEEIIWKNLIERSIDLNQLEILYFVCNILNYVYENLINSSDIELMKKYYDQLNIDNGLSTSFIRAALLVDLESLCFCNNYELSQKILLQMKLGKEVVNCFNSKYNIQNKYALKPSYFNQNLVEIKDLSIVENTIEKLKLNVGQLFVKVHWNEEHLLIEIPKLEINCSKMSLDSITVFFSKDENLSFFDEFCDSNPNNKNLSHNLNIFKFKKTIDGMHIELNEALISSVEVNKDQYNICDLDKKMVIKIPWIIVGIKPLSRRIINMGIYADYKIIESEIMTMRWSLDRKDGLKYSIYHPWSSEMARLKLVD